VSYVFLYSLVNFGHFIWVTTFSNYLVRVFYRVLTNQIDLPKFALFEIPWKNSIRIHSIAINTWAKDMRPLHERRQDPKIMDIGFADVDVSILRPKDGAGSSLHLINTGNRRLGQGQEKTVSGSWKEKKNVEFNFFLLI
jgi:hypothetical protein